MTVDRFTKRMHNSTTYECICCHRQTRETGNGEAGVDLCAFCYEAGGIENSFNDGHITAEEFNSQREALVAQYGERAHLECLKPIEVTNELCTTGPAPVEATQPESNEDAAPPTVKAPTKAKASKKPVAEKPGKGAQAKTPAVKAERVYCSGKQKNGEPCKMPVVKGTDTCFNHMPAEYRAEHGANAVRGPRWAGGTFEEVQVTVRKGTKTLVQDEARVILTIVDGKPTLTVEA